MVQAAEARERNDLAELGRLHGAIVRRVLAQGPLNAVTGRLRHPNAGLGEGVERGRRGNVRDSWRSGVRIRAREGSRTEP